MASDVLTSLLGIVGSAGQGYVNAREKSKDEATKAAEALAERTSKENIAGTEAKSRTDVAKIGVAGSLNEKLLSLQAERENLAAQLANDHDKWASANGIERDKIAEIIRNNTLQLKALNRQIDIESRKVDIEQQKANTEQASLLGTGAGAKGMKGKSPADFLRDNITKLSGDYLSGGGDPTKLGDFITQTLKTPVMHALYLGEDQTPQAPISGPPAPTDYSNFRLNQQTGQYEPPTPVAVNPSEGLGALFSSFSDLSPVTSMGLGLGNVGGAYIKGVTRKPKAKPLRP